jgi:hypothetical protein
MHASQMLRVFSFDVLISNVTMFYLKWQFGGKLASGLNGVNVGKRNIWIRKHQTGI